MITIIVDDYEIENLIQSLKNAKATIKYSKYLGATPKRIATDKKNLNKLIYAINEKRLDKGCWKKSVLKTRQRTL